MSYCLDSTFVFIGGDGNTMVAGEEIVETPEKVSYLPRHPPCVEGLNC